MEKLASLYQAHISILQQRTRDVLERNQLDALLIHSGELVRLFLDDRDYPFKANPHFKSWVPVTEVQNCWILVDGVNRPKLWFYSPVDYWYSVEPVPDGFWTPYINITPLKKADDIAQYLPCSLARIGYIGPNPHRAEWLGITAENINPKAVIDYLHYYRSYKTEYELSCLREAQKVAINGHKAAREAFYSDMSEFDINIAYLSATGHSDTNVPYDNIIALNEHSAVLHYTKLDQQPPAEFHSFLVDAGAEYNGYAADLTRTYARYKDSDFGLLIRDLNNEQLALIATMEQGVNFTDYNLQMHHRIAKLLKKFELIVDMSEEDIVETGISYTFFPHGLGHPLGLQVHDVAGFMQDDTGTHVAAPQNFPALRCTRVLEPGMVLTIEPGLYFIDTLLAQWRGGQFNANFNWLRIDQFRPYGGIRIEDNVVIRKDRIENMTRDLKLS
ncbi:Xaa-Pro dipeptidase [Budvicia diplopodorum]|uniref:Xaa-Pro dipeptidase n=1 Tax=Budvicia diplopodorum TaxID=1119056 RepID=UPI0013594964|nr:Xaa-Pro dipeptidase [Budvicia diplopodorum]